MTNAEHEAPFRPGEAAYVEFENAYIEGFFAENSAYLGLRGEIAGVVGSSDDGGCYTGPFKGGIDDRWVPSAADAVVVIVGWKPPT